MLRKVHLHGALKPFGACHELEVASAAEAVRALSLQLPGFAAAIRAGAFRLVRGDRRTGLALDADTLTLGLGRADLHIVPVAAGGRGKGGSKAILGVAIMAVAVIASPLTGGGSLAAAMGSEAFAVAGFSISYGNIAAFGLTMALSGISQLLAPAPKTQTAEAADQKQSYLFQGAQNLVEQGAAVPLIYGRVRTGSVLISAGISTADVGSASGSADAAAAAAGARAAAARRAGSPRKTRTPCNPRRWPVSST